nr:hypothetical protein [Tanacetum cinerariifolium]
MDRLLRVLSSKSGSRSLNDRGAVPADYARSCLEEMVTKFLSKYFPPSMVTKLRNDIRNFQQLPNESLFEAWERYKLLIDRCPNHNMLLVTQIDTFYNGLTLRHQDTINAAAGALTQKISKMNKNFLRMSQSNPQVKVVNPSCKTCGGPYHYSECQAAGGFTQGDVYAATGNYNTGAQMPKYDKMLKDLFSNKEKLLELANTPLNENSLVVLLKKLLEKLRDPRKFLIPCDFGELDECMALADLELANRSVAYPIGIADDVFLQVERPFLRMARDLVDVHEEELTLRADDEKLIFNKSIYPLSGNPTPSSHPVVASLSPSLTPFEDNDYLLEETDDLLGLDDSIPHEIDNRIFDAKRDILFLEKLLTDDSMKYLPPKEL